MTVFKIKVVLLKFKYNSDSFLINVKQRDLAVCSECTIPGAMKMQLMINHKYPEYRKQNHDPVIASCCLFFFCSSLHF